MSRAAAISVLAMYICTFAAGDLIARPTFHPPIAGDSVLPICTNFTYGNWQQREFYSPGYPGNYPNKTDCIHLIIAPRGYRIQLDFRDEFKIEPSPDCKYDYVEFRDGPFGYSPLIGRFCGSKHPPMMESSSRFMWVHFASDDSIEYKGFRIVYDFYKPGDAGGNSSIDSSVCHIEVDISKHEGYLSQDDIPPDLSNQATTTNKPLDCTWAFYLPADHRVTLRFEHLMTTLGSCDDSFLEIYEDTTAMADRRKKLCGSLPTFYKSDSNHAYIRLYAKRAALMPKFSAFFTVFIPGPCSPNLFECGDNTCIYKSLECNGNDNCNYRWDEQFCETSTVVVPTREPVVIQYHTVIIGIVGGAIITIILLAVVITCVQKSREEKRQHNVLHQEERQAMEIEMTNLLNRSPIHMRGNPVPGQRGDPNGPVNHVTATRPMGANQGNHVPHTGAQLAAHTQAISGAEVGHPDLYGKPLPAGRQTDIDGADFAEPNDAGGATTTYGRYLDGRVLRDRYGGEEPVQRSSGQGHLPTVVTIEKRPAPGQKLTLTERLDRLDHQDRLDRRPGPRDRTPSPRPDVVQEERCLYPESSGVRDRYYRIGPSSNPDLRIRDRGGGDVDDPGLVASALPPTRRRLSDETIRSDASDVWKPMTSPEARILPLYRRSGRDPDVDVDIDAPGRYGPVPEAYECARVAAAADHDRRPTSGARRPARTGSSPKRKSAGASLEAGDAEPGRAASSSSMPRSHTAETPLGGGRSKLPPAPPQRRTPVLTHQSSAPTPPAGDVISSRTPPPSHRPIAPSRTPPPPRARASSQGKSQAAAPCIFYTRPNPGRAERTGQPRQHHPV